MARRRRRWRRHRKQWSLSARLQQMRWRRRPRISWTRLQRRLGGSTCLSLILPLRSRRPRCKTWPRAQAWNPQCRALLKPPRGETPCRLPTRSNPRGPSRSGRRPRRAVSRPSALQRACRSVDHQQRPPWCLPPGTPCRRSCCRGRCRTSRRSCSTSSGRTGSSLRLSRRPGSLWRRCARTSRLSGSSAWHIRREFPNCRSARRCWQTRSPA
mmetsp:Transcript_104772/g.312999  ORF Transcript_104772/g.312999 Transcript_104772/m.312999 type:complete len:212 (+) Transcript_104772:559-1194(+)